MLSQCHYTLLIGCCSRTRNTTTCLVLVELDCCFAMIIDHTDATTKTETNAQIERSLLMTASIAPSPKRIDACMHKLVHTKIVRAARRDKHTRPTNTHTQNIGEQEEGVDRTTIAKAAHPMPHSSLDRPPFAGRAAPPTSGFSLTCVLTATRRSCIAYQTI